MTEDVTTTPVQADRDSLHVLPLSDIPLDTPVLRSARMVKNAKLDSVIEIFSGLQTGSGQLHIEDLPQEFGWDLYEPPPDLIVLRKLALLPSYDVYRLRLSLREHGIEVNSVEALKLSPTKS